MQYVAFQKAKGGLLEISLNDNTIQQPKSPQSKSMQRRLKAAEKGRQKSIDNGRG